MAYEITTPNGATLVIDKEDKEYFEDIQKRGYKVRELTAHRKPFEECEACSA